MLKNNISNKSLLIQVVMKWQPELLPIAKIAGCEPLTQEQRECLRGLVSDELAEGGLNKDYEPNSYGLLLEELIDQLGHI